MKPFIKRDERTDARTHGRTDGHRAFYNLPSRAYRPAGDKNLEVFTLAFKYFSKYLTPSLLVTHVKNLQDQPTTQEKSYLNKEIRNWKSICFLVFSPLCPVQNGSTL